MAAVVLQGSLHLTRLQYGTGAAAVSAIQHVAYSSDIRPFKKPALSHMRKGAGGRSSFNGVVATVFGCTGFMGRYVVNELGKHGTQMILPYRGDNYDPFPLKLAGDLGQVLFHPFHLQDEDSIRNAVKYSNVVINLIGRDWETKNFKFEDVHIHGARRLAKISREMGVEKFIHLSNLNINPKPEPKLLWKGSSVLRTKFYGEQAVREEFPEATIIRPAIVYGLEDRWLMHHVAVLRRSKFFGKRFPLYKKGEGITKMPVCVEDIATAIYEIIKSPDSAGKVYQAVGPHRYTLKDLMLWIMEEMRRNEENDFKLTDLRFSPAQYAKLLVLEQLPGTPVAYMHREILEMEATTDNVDYSINTLVELGIRPIPLENQITWLLKPHHHEAYLKVNVGEYEKVKPPSPVD